MPRRILSCCCPRSPSSWRTRPRAPTTARWRCLWHRFGSDECNMARSWGRCIRLYRLRLRLRLKQKQFLGAIGHALCGQIVQLIQTFTGFLGPGVPLAWHFGAHSFCPLKLMNSWVKTTFFDCGGQCRGWWLGIDWGLYQHAHCSTCLWPLYEESQRTRICCLLLWFCR